MCLAHEAAAELGEQTQGLWFPTSQCSGWESAKCQGLLCLPCDGAVPILRIFSVGWSVGRCQVKRWWSTCIRLYLLINADKYIIPSLHLHPQSSCNATLPGFFFYRFHLRKWCFQTTSFKLCSKPHKPGLWGFSSSKQFVALVDKYYVTVNISKRNVVCDRIGRSSICVTWKELFFWFGLLVTSLPNQGK